MNAGATAERVYDGLKQRVLSGELKPGERLEPERFAQALSSSVTPVRDAFNRLVGERLVETRASEGFCMPVVAEPMLRDLYAWNAALLRLVVRSWPRPAEAVRADMLPADPARAAPAFFARLALRSANREHAAQVEAVSDRLAAARAAETQVLDGIEAELGALAAALGQVGTGELLRLLAAYHRRRIGAAPQILAALYDRPRQ
jgi:DNA-binding FadR family transcriptional regulator